MKFFKIFTYYIYDILSGKYSFVELTKVFINNVLLLMLGQNLMKEVKFVYGITDKCQS